MEWMILPLKKYAQFTGRSRRMEFWMFVLLNLIIAAVVLGVKFGMGGATEAITANPENPLAIYSWMFSGVGLILALWWLATLVPNIAVAVRRLHDRNMSGWWYLGFIVLSLIPFVGLLVSIAYIVIMALPGTPGPNRFGEDPLGEGANEVFE